MPNTEDRINRRDIAERLKPGGIQREGEAIVYRHENGPAQGWADASQVAKPVTVAKPPLATGCLDYFPDALLEVAAVSAAGNAQHGTQGWDRSVAPDEANALARHFARRGTLDTDGQRHSAKVAWRALALLQIEIEAARLRLPSGGSNG